MAVFSCFKVDDDSPVEGKNTKCFLTRIWRSLKKRLSGTARRERKVLKKMIVNAEKEKNEMNEEKKGERMRRCGTKDIIGWISGWEGGIYILEFPFTHQARMCC